MNPRGGYTPPTRLAGEHFRPLSHPSEIRGVYFPSRRPCPVNTSARTTHDRREASRYLRSMDPVEALERIATLLERERAGRYKEEAFRKAADAIRGRPLDELRELAAAGAPGRPPRHRRPAPPGSIDAGAGRRGARVSGAPRGRGRARRRSRRADPRRAPGRPPPALRLVRRRGHHRADGPQGGRARPRLPRAHRPLAALTVAHGLDAERLATQLERGRASSTRSWRRSASSPASRSTSSRTARSTRTTTCSPSSTSSSPACTRSCA